MTDKEDIPKSTMEANCATLRRLNRMHTIVLGAIAGGLLIVLDKLLSFSDVIRQIGIIPFYLEGVVTTILSSMLLGALVALIFTLVRIRAIPALVGGWPPSWTLEAMLFGAVGAVAWWVVPLVLFFLAWFLLGITSLMFGVIITKAAELILGSPSNIPIGLFDWSMYLGGSVGGGVMGWQFGEFLVGLVQGFSGKQSWANRKYTILGVLAGVAFGIACGVVFVRFYMIEMFMNW